LNLGELQGESVNGGIAVLAWSWGMSSSRYGRSEETEEPHQVSVQALSITKWIDITSPDLMLLCSSGQTLDRATLVVRRYAKELDWRALDEMSKEDQEKLERIPYLTVQLEGVRVTSVSTGGSGGEQRLTENITLEFDRVFYRYHPQDRPNEPALYGWDFLNQRRIKE
jgi:type VI secretion system secreted protein Hcp